MKPLKYLAILVLLASSFFPVRAQNKAEVKVLFNIQEVLRGSDLKAKIDAFKAASKVNIYPAFHLEEDSALLPFAMELYFKVRRKCEEPYVIIALNFIPKGKQWTDFSNYGISISLTQGKQKSINPAMLTKAEIEVNKMLANVKNLGTEIATIKKKVEDLIDQLRAFKYRNIHMQLPLVNFYPVTGPQASQYGYDRLKYSGMEGEYKDFRRYDSTVVVPYKAMPTTGTETFMAVVTRGDTATRPDSIRYRNDAKTLVMPTSFPSDTLAIFTLTGAGGDNEFTAYYPVADSTGKVTEVPIGRIILRGCAAENKQLKLVPLATAGRQAGTLSPTTLETYLNGVYKQGAISWTVSLDKAWSPSTSVWDANDNDSLDIETGLFSRYSGEITSMLNAYTKDHPTVDDTYYLFVTQAPNTSGYLGYMPLNGQYGIIFMAATAPEGYYEREAAHELGHGAFGLEHAWKVYPLNQNSTPNLMDYNNGTELWAGQWKYMHEWHLKLGVGQDVEDGASIDCGSVNKPDNIKALVTALKTCSGIDNAVAKLTDAELSNNLCAEERKDILKCIAKGSLVGDEDEQSIIRVIKTTPLGQKAKLVELIGNEPNLLANLHSSIDGEELTIYYKELIMLYRLSKTKQDWDNIAKNFDNLEPQLKKKPRNDWAKQKMFFWLDVGLVDYLTEGRIVYHNEEITSNNHVKFDQYTSVLAVWTLNELKGVDLAPFDVIRLYFLSENLQLGMPKGEYADIPAIALRFLIQKQFNRDAWVAVNTGFVLGTLGSGSIATLWGKVDCVLGLGAILEDNYHNQLTKTPEGQAVLTAWKVLNVALLARLGYKITTSIPTAWRSLTEAIAKLRVKNPTLATQIENEAKQAFSEYNIVDDVLDATDIAKLRANGGAHTIERHGYEVTDDLLKRRATEGIAPDGSSIAKNQGGQRIGNVIPPMSSKFQDAASMKKALAAVDENTDAFKNALAAEQSRIGAGNQVTQFKFQVDLNETVGYGYKKPLGSNDYVLTGQKLQGESIRVEGLTKVEVRYKLNTSTGKYEINTMFPIE